MKDAPSNGSLAGMTLSFELLFFMEMRGKNLADLLNSLSFFIIACKVKRKLTAAERLYIYL